MPPSLDRTIDLRHYGRLLWRRRGILLLVMVATFCAALIALAFVPSEYESEVTLMIEESQLLSGELQELMGGMMRAPARFGADEERLAKLIGRIRSRPFLERVIRMLRMDDDPLIRARAEEEIKRTPGVGVEEMAIRILVENLQSRIHFGRVGPGIYQVTVADYDAGNAQTLARWISELFVDTSSKEALDRIRSAHEFGKEQLAIYQEQLRRSEAALERHEKSAIERTLRPGAVREGNLVEAEALYRDVTDEVSLARMRLAPYAEAAGRLRGTVDPSRVLADPEILEIAQSLRTTLRNELSQRLAAESGAAVEWPPAGALGSLRRGLLEQVGVVAARLYPSASRENLAALTNYAFSQLDLEAQQNAAAFLSDAIADYRSRAQSRPGGELERARLEEEVETNRRLLQSFQAQLVASDVSRAAELTNLGLQIEILNPAPLPLKPTRPDRVKILAAALVLGPLLGAGIAFLTEVLDPVLRNLEDFARIVPEPLLGTTPLLTRLPNRHGWWRRHWVPVGLAAVVLVTLVFFTVRGHLLHRMASVGVPVQVVDPGEMPDANP